MTVIPTGNEVTLTYGRRPIDIVGEFATGGSLAILLVGWIRFKRRRTTNTPRLSLRAS
jgi:hypothetical protein